MSPINESLIDNIIVNLKNRENGVKQVLKSKQEQIVFADGPNESAGISATRFALDSDIVMAENELKRITAIIREVEIIQKSRKPVIAEKVGVGLVVTVEINDKQLTFLLTNEAEDTENRILPITSPLGKNLLGHRVGDVVGDKIRIVEIR